MKIIFILRPYAKVIACILLLTLVANGCTLIFPWGLKFVLDGLISGSVSYGGLLLGLMLGSLLVKAVANFVRGYLVYGVGEKVVRDLRERTLDHILRLSFLDFHRHSPSQIHSRLLQDVDCARKFLFNDVIEFCFALLNIGLIALLLGTINASLTAVALLPVPLFAVIYFRFLPKLKKKHRAYRDRLAIFSSRLSEVFSGMRVVKSFGREDYEREQAARSQRDLVSLAGQVGRVHSLLEVLVEFFASLGVLSVLAFGASEVLAQRMTVGEFVAFYTYLGLLFVPVVRLVVLHSSSQEAWAALERINQIWDLPREQEHLGERMRSHQLVGSIVIDRLRFGYRAGHWILRDLSLSITAGQVVGIVGPSGAGKTTLLGLLLKFFSPQEGRIILDGVALPNLDTDWLRRNIAVVLQDDFLFNGTIAENIRYGNLSASREDIETVAQVAHIHEFIYSLPEGYETVIGDRGYTLSGGQRQRISLARALVRRPTILILDEATSAIDAMTENAIQASVKSFMNGKTVIVVAHRFSSIVSADQIIVMSQGQVVEQGDHNYLLKKEGFYSSLYKEQFSEEENTTILADLSTSKNGN